MNDLELKQQEASILERLERSETQWHWFKVFLVALSCIVTVAVVIYYNTSVLKQTKRNQATINCALHAFTPENYAKSSRIIEQCIENK